MIDKRDPCRTHLGVDQWDHDTAEDLQILHLFSDITDLLKRLMGKIQMG